MSKILWEASQERKLNSNLYKYEKFISKKYNLKFNQKYSSLLKWSIQNSGNFWDSIWDYCKIKGLKKREYSRPYCTDNSLAPIIGANHIIGDIKIVHW